MRVTIGMPVYNGAATIAAALDSLLSQTFRDFVLVISDNGSSDGTEAICRGYCARDPRVRYIRQPSNLGAAMNFRFVLMEARTPYFMWAAADDLWAPGFIATHLSALAANPRAVASQSRVLFTKGGQPSHMATGTFALEGSEAENLLRFLANPADNSRYYALFRTEALQEVFPPRNFHALDWGVSAAVLRHGTYLEQDQVLMVRDSSDPVVYESAVGRDHRRTLLRIFPLLYMTQWLVRHRRIPVTGSIIGALLHLNLYLHFRFGQHRNAWLAAQYLNPGSGLHRVLRAAFRPRPASELRAAARWVVRLVRRGLRGIWRRLPLPLLARQAVKRRLVQALGPLALRVAGSGGPLGQLRAVPPPPEQRGLAEDIWRLPPAAAAAEPALSVVLVVRDDLPQTLRCIDALADAGTPVQVVVVDNASVDVTPLALAGIPGLAWQRLPEAVPYGMALLEGLALVRAPAVAVLDAGVVPAANFAAEVLRGLERGSMLAVQVRDRAGYVRSVGGRFQAGPSTIAQHLTPDHPFCSVRKAVDYANGGFAFDRTLYQPPPDIAEDESLETASCRLFGTAATSYWPAAVVYRTDDRHAERVIAAVPDHVRAGPAAAVAVQQPTVLYIDAETPMPDQNSGSIDALNLMRLLQRFGFRVVFVPEDNFLYRGKYTDALLELGIEAMYADHCTSVEQALEQFGADLSLVVLCRAYIAHDYLDMVRRLAPRARIIFNTVDLHFLREERAAALSGDPAARAAAAAQRASELASIAAADATIVLSTHEQALLAEAVPAARVHVIPLVREVPEALDVPGFDGRRDCLFVGTYQHPPNEDAAVFFCTEVWPLVRARLPAARCLLVGSCVTPKVAALAGNGVEVRGFVEDLDDLLSRCLLTVAPLRYGAGLKGKLASSLRAGVPAVATSIAVEGSGLVDGEEVLVADTPQQMADAVVRLHEDAALWQRLSTRGFAFVRREYSMDANFRRLGELLATVGATTFALELAEVQAELRAAGPLYLPSAFWQRLSAANMAEIELRHLLRFKTTINNNYFQFLPGDFNDPQVRRLLRFWSAAPSPWALEAAESAQRLGGGTEVATAFDYNPFGNPAYPRFYGFFVGMLWYWACCHDAERLHLVLEEPALGQPIPVQVEGKAVSQDLANSLHEWSRIRQLVAGRTLRDRPRLLEIGAGYGRLAHVVLQTGRFRYAIVDIAPALVIAKWYLSTLFPKLRVFGFRPFRDFAEVAEEVEAADICFFSANQLALLPDGFADVGVAISCLHEMRHDQIRLYLDLLSAKVRSGIYQKNWTVWKNPEDGIEVNRASFHIAPPWRLVLDESHPINDQMWETGYLRG